MDLNEILDGMAAENCADSCGAPSFNSTANCGNSYDNCGQPIGVSGYNNYNYAGNNNCCGGFGNNNCGFGCGGGFYTLFWLLLLCGGGFGGGGFGGYGGGCGCCCHDDCCCGNGYGNGCAPLIWIIVLATLCGGNRFGFGNNCGNNFVGNCGC